MRIANLLALATFSGLTTAAAVSGRAITSRRPTKLWYRLLRKPKQTPPDWVFGVVWPALYALTAYSGYRVFKHRSEPAAKTALALWGAQLLFNASWTPLFFGKKRARAALGVLALNFVSLAAYALRARKVDRPAAAAVVPHLGWLAFASTINAGVIRRNNGMFRG